jgi:hypothetical protein
VIARLRKRSWKAPLDELLEVIREGEDAAESLRAAERWPELASLAGMISEAYVDAKIEAHVSGQGQMQVLEERRRHWCAVDLDAARRAEGEAGGPRTLEALVRLGRSRIDCTGDSTEAHRTFLEALEVAERLYGPDSPELVPVLRLAGTGAPPEVAVDLAERAVRLTEAKHGPTSMQLGGPLADLADALAEVDRIDEAITAAERAMDVSDEPGTPSRSRVRSGTMPSRTRSPPGSRATISPDASQSATGNPIARALSATSSNSRSGFSASTVARSSGACA